MGPIDAVRRAVILLVAAGGLGGAVTAVVFAAGRASTDDLAAVKTDHARLRQAHDDLTLKVDDDRREVRRRLDRLDAKQDRMIDILETLPRSRGR